MSKSHFVLLSQPQNKSTVKDSFVVPTDEIYNIRFPKSKFQLFSFFIDLCSSIFRCKLILSTPSYLKVIFVPLSQLQSKSTVYYSSVAATYRIYSIGFSKSKFHFCFHFHREKYFFQEFRWQIILSIPSCIKVTFVLLSKLQNKSTI